MTRRVMWVCRRVGGVAVLTLGAVAVWLPGSAPPATAAPGRNSPAWSTSQSTAGATGTTYTYTFKITGGAAIGAGGLFRGRGLCGLFLVRVVRFYRGALVAVARVMKR
jgi:hypothetical protein